MYRSICRKSSKYPGETSAGGKLRKTWGWREAGQTRNGEQISLIFIGPRSFLCGALPAAFFYDKILDAYIQNQAALAKAKAA